MAGLEEQAQWENDVYQIEQTDPVVGGPPDLAQGQGITNVPHQALANRTRWLKGQVEVLQTALENIDVSSDIQAAIDELIDGAPGALDTLNELAQAVQDNDGEIAAALSQLATAMNGANNLAEITDPAQARANIGAGTGVPLGAIAAFHQTVAPAGWLTCDGAPVAALYPELRAHLLAQAGVQVDGSGDPLLPDFRGEFLRGLDNGRGVDGGRVLGSWQVDEFKSHIHDLHKDGQGSGDHLTVDDSAGVDEGIFPSKTGMQPAGGAETRPRNIAALICMKAFDAVQPEGMADLSALLTGIATQVQAEEGLNNTALMTPIRVAQAIEAIQPQTYESPWTVPDNYSSTLFLHGLGQRPDMVSVEMRCTVTDGGHAVGDIILFGAEAGHRGSQYGFTTTLVGSTGLRFCLGVAITQSNATNGQEFNLNFGRWEYRVRASL